MSSDDQTIKILIVLARYYRDASDDLLKGATTELDKYKKFKKPKGWKEDKTFLLKFGWAKVSLILFPGLVESGEVNQFLSFWDAFYVALIIYFILKVFTTGIATVNKGKDDK